MRFKGVKWFFKRRKTLTAQLTLDVSKQKEVLEQQSRIVRRMTHQLDVLDASQICERSNFVFLNSPNISGKQTAVYHSELAILRCSISTVEICPMLSETTGDQLHGLAFCCIWLLLKDPYSRLLISFGLITISQRRYTNGALASKGSETSRCTRQISYGNTIDSEPDQTYSSFKIRNGNRFHFVVIGLPIIERFSQKKTKTFVFHILLLILLIPNFCPNIQTSDCAVVVLVRKKIVASQTIHTHTHTHCPTNLILSLQPSYILLLRIIVCVAGLVLVCAVQI